MDCVPLSVVAKFVEINALAYIKIMSKIMSKIRSR